MNRKYYLISIFALIVIGVGFLVWYRDSQKLPEERVNPEDIKTFSYSGQILEIKDEGFVFVTGRVEKTEDRGNQFIEYKQEVLVPNVTPMKLVSSRGVFDVGSDNKLDYLKIGDRVVVYVSEPIELGKNVILPEKIEVVR